MAAIVSDADETAVTEGAENYDDDHNRADVAGNCAMFSFLKVHGYTPNVVFRLLTFR